MADKHYEKINYQQALAIAIDFYHKQQFSAAKALLQQVAPYLLDNVNCLHYQGLVAYQEKYYDQAIAYIKQALQLSPDDGILHRGLAKCYVAKAQWQQGISHYHQAITLAPEDVEAYRGIADLLLNDRQFTKAEAFYQKVLDLQLSQDVNPVDLFNLANAQYGSGKGELAIIHLKQAIKLKPDLIAAYVNIAAIYLALGDQQHAIEYLEQALVIDPYYVRSYYNLANIDHYIFDDNNMHFLMTLLQRDMPSDDQVYIHFTLATIYDRQKNYTQAFDHYQQGNALFRASIEYDQAVFFQYVDRLIDTYCPAFIAQQVDKNATSWSPIFIVGMPRSGSTLIEQILNTHSQVIGIGETNHTERLIHTIEQQYQTVYPNSFQQQQVQWQQHRQQLCVDLQQGLTSPVRIVDKTLSNYFHVGLLYLLFPKAKFIYIQRDAIATCFSCYQHFFKQAQPYSYQPQELVGYYKLVNKMMAHWLSVLPHAILTVKYESLISSFQQEIQRILAFCELPWEENCLQFYQSKRLIQTSSQLQVKKPLYQQAVSHWKNYQAQLQPMIALLNEDI